MAYEVKFTDQANKGSIFVDDNTINTETSLSLPGRNSTAYGTAIAENFLHLLENFAKNTEPTNPVEGQLWYDNSAGVDQLKVYDGTAWAAAGGLKKAATEPDVANSVAGDLWVNTDSQQLYLFSGGGWVLVGPEFADGLLTGTRPERLTGIDNVDYNVLLVEVEAQPVAIIASDSFTPKISIAGFSIIQPGINLNNNNLKGAGAPKFIGVSEQAEALKVGNEVVPSSNFLRSDRPSTSNAQIRIKSNDGLAIGAGNQFNLTIENEAGVISHRTSGAPINVRVNDGGNNRTVLTVSGSSVGINNTGPEEALDVQGNILSRNRLLVDGTDQSTTFGNGAMVVKGGVGIARNLNVGGLVKIDGAVTAGNVVPNANNVRTLGSELIRWQAVYANTFIGNLTGNVTGTITGKSSTTDRLVVATNFRMIGDVTAPTFIFDGQTGGNTKTFNTTISNAFITNKPSTNFTRGDDEILINRVSGASTGVFKTTRRDLLANVPVNPPGVILAYAGATVPSGWLLCDGSEISRVTFPRLFAAIGFAFKDPSLLSDQGSVLFALPDLRGRFPLGLDNMGGSSAGRVSGQSAAQLGNSAGSENKTIFRNNLPDHEHTLRAPNGDQFYAINDLAIDVNSDPTAITFDAPTGTDAGQALGSSGGVNNGGPNSDGIWNQVVDEFGNTVRAGKPLDVMNPFLALNYIIYTGEG